MPCSQVIPTAPYPVTGCGWLISSDPAEVRREVDFRLPGATRAPAGAVSEYSFTVGSTTSSGTADTICEACT